MSSAKHLVIGGIVIVGVWLYLSRDTITTAPAEQISGDIFQGVNAVKKAVGGWNDNLVPAQYRAAISEAERVRNLPAGMLARLLYQESHYRPDIISGATRSSAGALGIAQFMPATAADMGINPLDPFQAIPAAARYLSQLYRMTGDWSKALAAYNWGVGNVTRKGLAAAPSETVTYYSSILSDIGLA